MNASPASVNLPTTRPALGALPFRHHAHRSLVRNRRAVRRLWKRLRRP